MRHSIEYFLNLNDSLRPTDAALGDIANEDWWKWIKPLWDDVLWMHYGDRVVFFNNRFPVDDDEMSINNIIRTFAINIKTKALNYKKIFDALQMDYNPLWNVDGVTGTISQSDHTGTDTREKSGDDTIKASGTDTDTLSGSDVVSSDGRDVVTLSGSDEVTLSGSDTVEEEITKDDTTRSGNEVHAKSGYDALEKDGTVTDTKSVTTFDSQGNWLDSEKSVNAPDTVDTNRYNSSDTITYNNVKDAHQKEGSTETTYGRVDTTEYGKVDTTAYGREDTTEYGRVDTKVYGRQDKTTYNSTEEETKDLTDKFMELQIRQGNIGITKSTELLMDHLSLWDDAITDFAKRVLHDCVNLVSYGCEGV